MSSEPKTLTDCVLKQICVNLILANNLSKPEWIDALPITHAVQHQLKRMQASAAEFLEIYDFILRKIDVCAAIHIQDGVVKADATFQNLYNKKVLSLKRFHLLTIACGNEELYRSTQALLDKPTIDTREGQWEAHEKELLMTAKNIYFLEQFNVSIELDGCLNFLELYVLKFVDFGWMDGFKFLIRIIRKRENDYTHMLDSVIKYIFDKTVKSGKKWIRAFNAEASELIEKCVWRQNGRTYEDMKPYFEALGRRELERRCEKLRRKIEDPKVGKMVEDLVKFLAE
ncbi:hypothetical protein L596_017062 [Steinernema carpocapsae]|nr:hypothetical protein L596_017062 [Steinernema carpocapsae]